MKKPENDDEVLTSPKGPNVNVNKIRHAGAVVRGKASQAGETIGAVVADAKDSITAFKHEKK